MSLSRVSRHKVVSVTYQIRSTEGEILEHRDLPVNYLHGGASDIFPEVESALEGKEVGDSITVDLTPECGFGNRDPNLIITDDVETFPPELRKVGAELGATNDKGEEIHFRTVTIEDDQLTVDGNHPLAGLDIVFEVKVVGVREPTPDELAGGELAP